MFQVFMEIIKKHPTFLQAGEKYCVLYCDYISFVNQLILLTKFGKVCYDDNHMMTTVNLSISQEQINLIDSFVATHGFTNRSECIRSVLRLLKIHPQIMEEAATFPFVAPTSRSTKKIISDFRKTKKYSAAFLKDLELGLKESDYFRP